jgi:hypothetical protein
MLYSVHCILYKFTAEYESVPCYYEINNEISGFSKSGEFSEQMSYYWILCIIVLGLNRFGLEEGQVAGTCECGNDLRVRSVNCGEFIDWLITG